MKKLTALLLSLLCVPATVLQASANAPHYPPGTNAPMTEGTKLVLTVLLLLAAITLFFLLRRRRK